MTNNKVEHPSHYTWLKDICGIEVIDITRHMNFNRGNVIKYVLRCGHKAEEGYSEIEKAIEDLKKAKWYLEDEIKLLESKIESNENKDNLLISQKPEIQHKLKSNPVTRTAYFTDFIK